MSLCEDFYYLCWAWISEGRIPGSKGKCIGKILAIARVPSARGQVPLCISLSNVGEYLLSLAYQ